MRTAFPGVRLGAWLAVVAVAAGILAVSATLAGLRELEAAVRELEVATVCGGS